MVASPYGLPSVRDADEAASWAARWVRDVVGPQTAVHVLMPDASAGSRIIWDGSECLQVGPDVTEAAGGYRVHDLSYLPSSEEDCFGFFPLLSRADRSTSWSKVWVDPGHPDAIFQMLLPVEEKELQRFAS